MRAGILYERGYMKGRIEGVGGCGYQLMLMWGCHLPLTATPLKYCSTGPSGECDNDEGGQVRCVLTGKSGRNWAMWEGVMTGTEPSCSSWGWWGEEGVGRWLGGWEERRGWVGGEDGVGG